MSYRNTTCVARTALYILASLSALTISSSAPSPELGPSKADADMVAYARNVRTTMERGLAKMAHTKRARFLLDFFRRNSFVLVQTDVGIPKPVLGVGADPNSKEAFGILILSRDQTQRELSPASFDADRRIMFLSEVFTSTEWQSVITYHELEHAYRLVTGRMVLVSMYSDPWIAEELLAYRTSCDILRTWRPSEYAAALRLYGTEKEKIWEVTRIITPQRPTDDDAELGAIMGHFYTCIGIDQAGAAGKSKHEAFRQVLRTLH